VASAKARAGLRDACPISYIQYIGETTGAPASSDKDGGRPNSPIGIANPFDFALQQHDGSILLRQSALWSAKELSPPLTTLSPMQPELSATEG
jgi:hypothetical protein